MSQQHSYSHSLASPTGEPDSWFAASSSYSPGYAPTVSSLRGSTTYTPSTMSTSSNTSAVAQLTKVWQDKLESHCRQTQKTVPAYSIVSDRRGKRTAWSCTVTVPGGPTASAIYWYDGQYVNGAKEDAAEVAFRILSGEGRRGSGSTGKVEEWGRRAS